MIICAICVQSAQSVITFAELKKTIMGRGDKKTKKGKIFKGSFGKSRPASEKKTTGNQPAAVKKEA
ncbi:MAG: 30S ribosomal protein THX [Flavisolibacter sp.]